MRGNKHSDSRAVHERQARKIHHDAALERVERCSQAVSCAQVQLTSDHDDRGRVEADDLDCELSTTTTIHPLVLLTEAEVALAATPGRVRVPPNRDLNPTVHPTNENAPRRPPASGIGGEHFVRNRVRR